MNHTERKEYLSLCKKYAAYRDVRGVVHNPDVASELLVTYADVVAYPLGYRLEYTTTPNKGQVIGGKTVTVHSAILRLAEALTEMTVPLEDVEKA